MTRAIGAAAWLCIGAACAPNLDLDYGSGAEPGRSTCRPSLAPHDVRRAAPVSALAGQTLDVAGVVTLALSVEPERTGFFLQSLDDDGDPLSAEALFVAWPGAAPAVGTRVHARGTLGETAGVTELRGIEQLDECGSGQLSPRRLDAHELEPPEAWDGQWVRVRGDWRVLDVPPSPADGRVTASPRGRAFASGHVLGDAPPAQLWTVRPALAAPSGGERATPRLGSRRHGRRERPRRRHVRRARGCASWASTSTTTS
jgi:hypothetical protein